MPAMRARRARLLSETDILAIVSDEQITAAIREDTEIVRGYK